MGLGVIVNAIQQQQAAAAATSPDTILANLTRQQYDDFIANFGQFETDLVARAQNDKSLIDQAKLDAPKAAQITKGVATRNADRYGIGLMPDQLKARDKAITRQGALGASDAINNSRLAQRELNDNLMDGLIDVGNGVQSTAIGQLSSSAADATARKNAYSAAKAQSQANTYSTIGSLGAAAILAFAF